MPVLLEVPFRLIGDSAQSLSIVEQLADAVELDVDGIGEVIGWDHSGATGQLLVGGDEQYEPRLMEIVRAHVLATTAIDVQRVDVVVYRADVELSRRQVEL